MATPHRFRFGVLTDGVASRSGWRELARRAEAHGYSTLLLADHLNTPLAPLTALVSAAEATTTLRVGNLVLANDFRHPAMLAKEAATLDILTDGRFEFGLGTGWLHKDYEQMGVAFDSPGTRVSRFEEAVQVYKGLFADGPLTYEGRYYTIRGLDGQPKPVQKPHPPLVLGGGSKRILSIAAREADIVSVNIRTTAEGWVDGTSISRAATEEKIAWIRAAAGPRFSAIELNVQSSITAITERPRDAARQWLRSRGFSEDDAAVEDLLASPVTLMGAVEKIVEMLQARREQLGFSYIVIWNPRDSGQIEQFAPVVARLAGM